MRRDRLLAGLALMIGAAVLFGIPFALQAGAEFFLPLTAAIVIAIALVPALEWLERRRIPSPVAAVLCLIGFLLIANTALVIIVLPASTWFRALPDKIGQIQANLAPVIDLYSSFQHFVDDTLRMIASGPAATSSAAALEPPRSLIELAATSAPSAAVQMLFAILVVYFFLAGWTRLRRHTINSRGSFDGAMATARVIQDVVDSTSAYVMTIATINLILGLCVAGAFWFVGVPSPLMWGGIVAIMNFVPYMGPVVAALLIAAGGLMVFTDIWMALLPAAIQIGFHLVEANIVTPMVLGRRLTMNPLLILISLAFWSWVWGTPGALLAVPLLIIIQTVLGAVGMPDVAGFLFESGTLTRIDEEEEKKIGEDVTAG